MTKSPEDRAGYGRPLVLNSWHEVLETASSQGEGELRRQVLQMRCRGQQGIRMFPLWSTLRRYSQVFPMM
jgi:hypothetical protein